MLSQRRKRLAKRRRSARYASKVADRLMQCLEHEYGDVVAIAIGVAIGAKQSPAQEPGKGQGMRCEAEQSGLGDGQKIDRTTGRRRGGGQGIAIAVGRSTLRWEEHTAELTSIMSTEYAVFC